MGVFIIGGTKMTNNEKALDILVSQLHKFIKDFCKKLDFDRTHTGIVSSVKSGECVVKYNGTDIHVKTSETDIYKTGDVVKLCIPCGNKRKAFIINELSKSNIPASVISYSDVTGTIEGDNVQDILNGMLLRITELEKNVATTTVSN